MVAYRSHKKVIYIHDKFLEENTFDFSMHITKPTICICENKGADHLYCHCTADQRLCFRYTDSTSSLQLKSIISSFKPASLAVQLRHRFTVMNMNDTPGPIGPIH